MILRSITCSLALGLAAFASTGYGADKPEPAKETPSADMHAADTPTAEAPAAEVPADQALADETKKDEAQPDESAPVDLFDAMDNGDVEVKFIAKSDRAARVIIENKTDAPVNLELPEAFVGVPALAQGGFGGGGFGGGGLGGGGGQQSVGGGFGGGGGGLGGGGFGGGGAFSIPPEKSAKLNVPVLCLDHGKQDPSSTNPYEIKPAESVVDRAEVIVLLKAFGRGELHHGAAQAAVWNLNNDIPWQALAAKLAGTPRDAFRHSYFSRNEIRAGIAYAQEAARRAYEQDSAYRTGEALVSASERETYSSPGTEPTTQPATDAQAAPATRGGGQGTASQEAESTD